MAGISVVICSDDDRRFEEASQTYARLLEGGPFEMIRMSGARGMAQGFNRGLAQSTGDWVIFSQDDVEFLATDFRERLLEHMTHCDVLGVAGTRLLTAPGWRMAGPPHLYGQIASPSDDPPGEFSVTLWTVPGRWVGRMQALDGAFLCVGRDVATKIRFDQDTFQGDHLFDVDFTYRAHLQGFNLSAAMDLFPIDHSPVGYTRDWIPHAQAFLKKFPSLPIRPAPSFQSTTVSATSRDDIVRVMTPPHWDR